MSVVTLTSSKDVSKLQPVDQSLFPAQRSCPKCGKPTVPGAENAYKCEEEKLEFCALCHEERKEDHPKDACLALSRTKAAALLKAGGVKGCLAETVQCPECQLPHLKRKEHQEFQCVLCKKEWCSSCQAPFEPIAVHGELWHKMQCPLGKARREEKAAKEVEAKKKNDQCGQCRAGTECCKPPN